MVCNMDTTTIIIIICILVIVGFALYMETRLQNNSGNCISSHRGELYMVGIIGTIINFCLFMGVIFIIWNVVASYFFDKIY